MENKNIKIDLNDDVNYILDTLEKANFEAYVVGGFVRDFLLSKKCNDVDITTSALPNEVKSLFSKTIDTGLKHGTVTLIINKSSYEVTTFRIDGEYLDSRHPKNVIFTRSLKEDLRRRDFTINAFAYNNKVGLVDYFNGSEDLKNKIIRAIDDPYKRFKEDALRILRCFRFSAQLDFKIDENTLKAASLLAPLIQNISNERIRDELVKILMSDHPEVLILASKMGVTKYFFDEFDLMLETKQENPYHSFDVCLNLVNIAKAHSDYLWQINLRIDFENDYSYQNRIMGDKYCGDDYACIRTMTLDDIKTFCDTCNAENIIKCQFSYMADYQSKN